MSTTGFRRFVAAIALLPVLVDYVNAAADPCAEIAGQQFVVPNKALACLKSFPFNETLKQNVLTNVARVFDFYTFEDFYLNSPPPFQDSTTNIRADIAKINATVYATDYDFNRAVYNFTTRLNDGHTRYFPNCYNTFQNLLPTPLVAFTVDPSAKDGTQSVFVAPDSTSLIPLIGTAFTDFFSPSGPSPFDWQRLAGARVLSINGLDTFAYADLIADTESGNFLDHGVRVNSAFGSYRISNTDFSQRFGDISGPAFPDRDSLTLKVIPANGTRAETVVVPYVANYLGAPFNDAASFWAVNCAATSATNGVDLKGSGVTGLTAPRKRQARASIIDTASKTAVGLPDPFLPTLPPQPGSTGVIKSFILPGNRTGVLFVGSFEGDFVQFQTDTDAAIKAFQAAGVTRLLIDLTNNGGGFVCLGQFLHQYLAGTRIGNPGFQSTNRANPLAQKIVAADIALGLNDNFAFYTADNFAFLNNTQMPASHNYITPSVAFRVNGTGATDQTSQRFLDTCDEGFSVRPPATPPFNLSNVAIVSNGNCASTCAMFSTLMFERHQTKVAIFGGKPGEKLQYKGMAGNQVLEWADLDTEIKTAGVKSDPLAPPDLLVNSNMRHNWRIAWSFFNEQNPIEYQSELPQFRFAYTNDTYNNPQKLWIFAEQQLFK